MHHAPLGLSPTQASRGQSLQSCAPAVCLALGATGGARSAQCGEGFWERQVCAGDSLADRSHAPAEVGPVGGAPHPHARSLPAHWLLFFARAWQGDEAQPVVQPTPPGRGRLCWASGCCQACWGFLPELSYLHGRRPGLTCNLGFRWKAGESSLSWVRLCPRRALWPRGHQGCLSPLPRGRSSSALVPPREPQAGSSAWASCPRLGGGGADLRPMIQHPTVPDPSILAPSSILHQSPLLPEVLGLLLSFHLEP